MSLDIVNLIESNPLTKLNGNYQSKMIEKVNKIFSNYEQQMFIASFYCFLNYNSKTDFVIDLDNVWKWMGFSNKAHSKLALEKNFFINKDYKSLLTKLSEQKNPNFAPQVGGAKTDTRGGHNKEIIMLNVETFKKFCLKAGTKKADEIHDYFIKLEEIMHEVLQEESSELKQQLEQAKEENLQIATTAQKEYEIKLNKEKILEREKILLKEYGAIGAIVYIIKVKTLENGQYVVKIGESRRGITNRYNEHKSKYDECLLLDCFSVQKSKDFESFLHNEDRIRPSKITNLAGHENELELFLIGKQLSYNTLLKIINHNIKYFDNNDTNKLQLENEQLKIMVEMNKNNNGNDNPLILELVKQVKLLTCKIENLETTQKEFIEKHNSSQTKVVTGFNNPLVTLGPRLQCIHPETLQLVKVYESVSECMNQNNEIKRPSINKAVVENTIYHGFRWLLVERNLDPNIITNLQPTKTTRPQNIGYIAKLNKEKSEILNVYLDRKTAAHENGYESSSALDTPVKNQTISNGHFYALFDSCDEELIAQFITKNNNREPLLYKNGVGQFDAQNNLIKEFTTKYDCIKSLKMSDKTLEKALDKNVLYNNHYFKCLDSKVKCF